MDQSQYTCNSCNAEWYYTSEEADQMGGDSFSATIDFCPNCRPGFQGQGHMQDQGTSGTSDSHQGGESGQAAGAASDTDPGHSWDDGNYTSTGHDHDGGQSGGYDNQQQEQPKETGGFWNDDD